MNIDRFTVNIDRIKSNPLLTAIEASGLKLTDGNLDVTDTTIKKLRAYLSHDDRKDLGRRMMQLKQRRNWKLNKYLKTADRRKQEAHKRQTSLTRVVLHYTYGAKTPYQKISYIYGTKTPSQKISYKRLYRKHRIAELHEMADAGLLLVHLQKQPGKYLINFYLDYCPGSGRVFNHETQRRRRIQKTLCEIVPWLRLQPDTLALIQRRVGERLDYNKHIASRYWKDLCARLTHNRGPRCERCSATQLLEDLHLHHKTYLRFGKELDDDVQLVCSDCHMRIHGRC